MDDLETVFGPASYHGCDYSFFEAHGFANTRGDATVDLETSKTAVMRSPSGCMISLVKHIK